MLVRLLHQPGRVLFIALLTLLCLNSFSSNAQYFDLQPNKKRVNIPFKMIRDMVIIQLKINNKGPFNFILDTGVGLMLVTDPKLVDSIDVISKRTLKISGLGEGDDFEAYVTSALNVGIPGLVSYDLAAAILKKDHFGLSNYVGMPIHGLLGYEFFNNLAVKLDFNDSVMTVTRPKDIKLFKQGTKVPISIEDRKPYLNAKVTFPNGDKTSDKLIIDIGAGHPLLLENIIKKHGMPQKFIPANLGIGLTGPIDGFLSRIKELEIGKFKIKNIITSFPDDRQIQSHETRRDGNIGMGILKRFNLIIDYPDSAIYLKPLRTLRNPFEHDMSGMEYYSDGTNLDRVIISRVEPGSAADLVGIEAGDEITTINLKLVSTMTLEDIDAMFRLGEERSLLLEVLHDNKVDRVILTLKKRI